MHADAGFKNNVVWNGDMIKAQNTSIRFVPFLALFEAFQSKGFHTNTNKSRFLHSYDIVKDVKDHRILVNQYQFPLHAFNRIDLSPAKIESFTRHNFEFSHSVLASFFRTFIHITTENGFFNLSIKTGRRRSKCFLFNSEGSSQVSVKALLFP